MTREEKVVCDL